MSSGRASSAKSWALLVCTVVRAENHIHGSDQHSCSPGGRPVMITDHVPAVLLPPDHPGRRVAAAVPAGGCVEDHQVPGPPAGTREPRMGYRRIHGELAGLGVKVA